MHSLKPYSISPCLSYSLVHLSLLLSSSCLSAHAQSVVGSAGVDTPATTTSGSVSVADVDTTAHATETGNSEDCVYDDSITDYLSCAKDKVSTTTLIGAGIGVTLGIFVLAFTCIWLTKRKRSHVSELDEMKSEYGERNGAGDTEEQGMRRKEEVNVPKIGRDNGRESIPPVPPLPPAAVTTMTQGGQSLRRQPSQVTVHGRSRDPKAATVEDAPSSSDEMPPRRPSQIRNGADSGNLTSTYSHRSTPSVSFSGEGKSEPRVSSHSRSQSGVDSQSRLTVPQDSRKPPIRPQARSSGHGRNQSTESRGPTGNHGHSRDNSQSIVRPASNQPPVESRAGSPVQATHGPRPLLVTSASSNPRLYSLYNPDRPDSSIQSTVQVAPRESSLRKDKVSVEPVRSSTYTHPDLTHNSAVRSTSRASTFSSRDTMTSRPLPPDRPRNTSTVKSSSNGVSQHAVTPAVVPGSHGQSNRRAIPLRGASTSAVLNPVLTDTYDPTSPSLRPHGSSDAPPVPATVQRGTSSSETGPSSMGRQRRETLMVPPNINQQEMLPSGDEISTRSPTPTPSPSVLGMPESTPQSAKTGGSGRRAPSPTPPLTISKKKTLPTEASDKASASETRTVDDAVRMGTQSQKTAHKKSIASQHRKSVFPSRSGSAPDTIAPALTRSLTDVAPRISHSSPSSNLVDSGSLGTSTARPTPTRGGTMPIEQRKNVHSSFNLVPSYYQPTNGAGNSSMVSSTYSAESLAVSPSQGAVSSKQSQDLEDSTRTSKAMRRKSDWVKLKSYSDASTMSGSERNSRASEVALPPVPDVPSRGADRATDHL